MANDEEDGIEQSAKLGRRDVLAGGAATVAMAALPEVAVAKSKGPGGFSPFGAIYMDPRYLATFNGRAYSAANIGNGHRCGTR